MRRGFIQKDNFLCLSLIGYSIFIISIILILIFDNPSLRSFALVTFFFVPGFLLIETIKPTKIHYNLIELMVISFGLSMTLIIMITYFLIILGKFSAIFSVYVSLTTILFIFLILKHKIINKNHNNHIKKVDNSFSKKLYFLINNHKESFVILVLIFVFFSLGFFLKHYNFFRFPDEYLYLWSSNQAIIPDLRYDDYNLIDFHIIISSVNKIGYILTLSFYFTLTGTTLGICPQVLSIFFYSMLIPVTYLLGSQHSKKTGIIATLFIASNPIIWFWSNHIMPDILYTVITTSCFYFFYKAFYKKRGKIRREYLIPAVLFVFLSYTQQPKILFVWLIPFIIYYFSSIINNKKLLIYSILFFFLGVILSIIVLILVASWFFEYDLIYIFDRLFSIFKFNNEDWISFFSPGGTIWNCFGFPYYFSHVIIILIIVGGVCLIKDHSKRQKAFFILTILFTMYFHLTMFPDWDSRFSFIIYPLLMVLAAMGFSANLGYYSLFLIPLTLILFPLIPINEPGVAISPSIIDWVAILSRVIGLLIIVYKVFEGISTKRIKFISKPIKKLKNPSFILIIIVSSSLLIGNTLSTNEMYFRNETITPEEVGLPQAGTWIKANIPCNSVIITNCRAHTLNYYTDSSFNSEGFFILDKEGKGWIITPKTEEEFNEIISENKFDYMMVFTNSVVGEPWRRPFFNPYIKSNNLFTVYENLVLLNSSFNTFGATEGNINFSIDYIDKIQGLNTIKINGTSNEDGITHIHFYLSETLNLENAFSFSFWIKLNGGLNIYETYFYLWDDVGNYRFWNDVNLLNYSNNWEKKELLMNSYYNQNGLFNKKNINHISIYIESMSNSSISFNLDNFFEYSNLKVMEI